MKPTIPTVEEATAAATGAAEAVSAARARLAQAQADLTAARAQRDVAEGTLVAARLVAGGVKPARVASVAERCARGDLCLPGDQRVARVLLDGEPLVRYQPKEVSRGRLLAYASTSISAAGRDLAAWWRATGGAT